MKTINGDQIWDDTSPEYPSLIAAAHVKPSHRAPPSPIRRTPGHWPSKTLACEDQGEDSVEGFPSTAPRTEDPGVKIRLYGSHSSSNVRCRKGVEWAATHMGLFASPLSLHRYCGL